MKSNLGSRVKCLHIYQDLRVISWKLKRPFSYVCRQNSTYLLVPSWLPFSFSIHTYFFLSTDFMATLVCHAIWAQRQTLCKSNGTNFVFKIELFSERKESSFLYIYAFHIPLDSIAFSYARLHEQLWVARCWLQVSYIRHARLHHRRSSNNDGAEGSGIYTWYVAWATAWSPWKGRLGAMNILCLGSIYM